MELPEALRALFSPLRGMFPHKPVATPFPDDPYQGRRKLWVSRQAERERAIPQSLTLCYSIGECLEEPIVLAPDGRYITSGARDGSVRLWDPSTSTEVRALSAHVKPIAIVAWSASGLLASGARDSTICVWEPETGELLHTLMGHSRAISALAWSPRGNLLASGSEDKMVQIWDTRTGARSQIFHGHARSVRSLAWSPDEDVLVSGDDGGQIRLWNVHTGRPIYTIDAHTNVVRSLAWSLTKNESLFASAGSDATVRLWDAETGRLLHRLEEHTRQVTGVVFSPDGRLLVSQSTSDRAEVCFWRTDTWELLASLPINPFRSNFPLAFQTNASLLLTGGDAMDEVRIWQIDIEALLQSRRPTVRYSNAKVVLTGDSGVGKTGLFHVICGEKFRPTESTHARQVLVLDSQDVPLNPGGGDDNRVPHERREILLWDLAGQPGYRVIHQLHLTEVTLGLVVFDGRNEMDPFGGVRYWDRVLRQAHKVSGGASLSLKKLLVAARVDRGGIAVSRERVYEFVQKLGFDRYIETSAKEGVNIDQLREAIKESIMWDAVPHVTSNELFQTIKAFLLETKEKGFILARTPDLYKALIAGSRQVGPDSEELKAQFERCIELVESSSLIKRFSFSDYVLLQPEVLDAYASALVNDVRDEPDGLGSILESRAKNCEFRMPQDARIANKEDEKLLLLAMIQDMLHHELVMLEPTSEGNYLVFPSQSTRVNQKLPDPEEKALIFEFEGPIQNIYATLAVRLSRSEFFRKKDLWKDAITFLARDSGLCGLMLEIIGEARARLTLFFSLQASEETRFYFEYYVEKHLQRWVTTGLLRRMRLFTCPEPDCRELMPPSTVFKRRERGLTWVRCPNCETLIEIAEEGERVGCTTPSQTLEMDSAADRQRQLDVLCSIRREVVGINLHLGQQIFYYDTFLCYDPDDRPVIRQIGDLLLERNILPWFDDWEVKPGQDWYQILSMQIDAIGTVTVFVGKESSAPWLSPQIDQLLRSFAKKRRVIPVILFECEQPPQLPDYMKEAWVDLRVSELDPIASLIERITAR